MIEHSTEITQLIAALHAASPSLSGVKRDSINPHFKNRYATLEAVIDAAKGPLFDNGIVFTQAPGRMIEGSIELTTMLMHKTGQWMKSTIHIPLSKQDPQGAGSAITYGCRYALMAMLGLPPIDDDAEGAIDRKKPEADLEAAKKATSLIKLVTDSTSVADLDTLSKDKDFKKLYKELPLAEQARVGRAGQDARDRLTPKTPMNDEIPAHAR